MTSMQRLVEILTNKGALLPDWAAPVASADRGLFIPDIFEGVDKAADPDRWLRMVYGDLPIITQVNDGQDLGEDAFRLPTSSSSMPSLMLEMLGLLDVRDGHKVLEVGAGTGLNIRWIAQRVGADNATSIEIDPGIAETARRNLEASGLSPTVLTGDGMIGCPSRAPFDRLICTYTVREVPYSWVEQTPGGRIVAPWGSSFYSHSFVTLDVADGAAQGRFTGTPAFMWDRTHRAGSGRISDYYRGEVGTKSRTKINPRNVRWHDDAEFAISLTVTDAWCTLREADDGSDEATYWILADDRKSWATVEYVPGREDYEVDQYGPRNLWDEVEAAWHHWDAAGRPGRDRFGLTVDGDGQRVWLDETGNTWSLA
ncbi:methyltransferase domain-containing protein [Streptomyces chattanoogensis]|uniref:methyltransferase domain-containing protein n=1 Tax=Streptomyces chattanoogensis TaxID=66876 RepID=UPI00369ADB6E